MSSKRTEQPVSRRNFLNLVAAAGGSAAVYQTGLALGLIAPRARAQPMARLGDLRKLRVVILGAGISGLTAAYELEQAGCEVTLLEASSRLGGRNLTVRSGDVLDELGNPQPCRFDDHPDLYLNCGPARIPGHHRLLLHYCRLFEVALEPFINVNYQAYVHEPDAFDGKPVRQGAYMADARGYLAEVTAKSLGREELDKPFSEEDRERLFKFLRSYGDLDEKLLYPGSSRRGYERGGFTAAGVVGEPFDFTEMLQAKFWQGAMNWGELHNQQATMLQAVGGNDRIIQGFVRNIRSRVITDAPVRSIQLREAGVEVVYAQKGGAERISADYCLNCIPVRLVYGIRNNFPDDYLHAMTKTGRNFLCKIGLQAKERFWEKEGIYGGITWTNQEVEQLWYPSHGAHGAKGVLLGGYLFDQENCRRLTAMSPEERLELAVRNGERIHPDYRSQVETGVTVCWQRMNHQLGCLTTWTEETLQQYFPVLQRPAGRHYLIGDQISHDGGWQEGAISSAHLALADLQERERARG